MHLRLVVRIREVKDHIRKWPKTEPKAIDPVLRIRERPWKSSQAFRRWAHSSADRRLERPLSSMSKSWWRRRRMRSLHDSSPTRRPSPCGESRPVLRDTWASRPSLAPSSTYSSLRAFRSCRSVFVRWSTLRISA